MVSEGSRKGNAKAMNNIGLIYERGYGDYTEAMYWYLKAADKGNAEAMNNIGYLYEKGLGVTQDYEEARKWHKKAAKKRKCYVYV